MKRQEVVCAEFLWCGETAAASLFIPAAQTAHWLFHFLNLNAEFKSRVNPVNEISRSKLMIARFQQRIGFM